MGEKSSEQPDGVITAPKHKPANLQIIRSNLVTNWQSLFQRSGRPGRKEAANITFFF
jgi:hypothetical protein